IVPGPEPTQLPPDRARALRQILRSTFSSPLDAPYMHLVPRLCLGTYFPRGSASRHAREAEPRDLACPGGAWARVVFGYFFFEGAVVLTGVGPFGASAAVADDLSPARPFGFSP